MSKKKNKNRFEQKQSEKKRLSFVQKIKRFFIACIILIVLGFFIFLGDEFTRPSFFPILHVQVKVSQQYVDQHELQNTVLQNLSGNFFTVNMHALENGLLQNAWIKNVSIRRVWPDTLSITLSEHQPMAVWNNTSLITQAGFVFSPPQNTFPASLPLLQGPDDSQRQLLQSMQNMNQILLPLQLSLSRLTLDENNNWTIILNNTIRVILGQQDPIGRLNEFVELYPKIIGSCAKQATLVDMRYSNGLAIQWLNGKKCIPHNIANQVSKKI